MVNQTRGPRFKVGPAESVEAEDRRSGSLERERSEHKVHGKVTHLHPKPLEANRGPASTMETYFGSSHTE